MHLKTVDVILSVRISDLFISFKFIVTYKLLSLNYWTKICSSVPYQVFLKTRLPTCRLDFRCSQRVWSTFKPNDYLESRSMFQTFFKSSCEGQMGFVTDIMFFHCFYQFLEQSICLCAFSNNFAVLLQNSVFPDEGCSKRAKVNL